MVLRYTRYLHLPTYLILPLTKSSSSALSVQTRHYSGIFHGRKIPLMNCQEYNFVNIVKTEFVHYSNQLMHHRGRSVGNIFSLFGFQWSHGQQLYKSFMRFIPSLCTELPLYRHGSSKHACYAQSRSYSTVSAPQPVKQTIPGIQEDFLSLKSKRVVRRKRSNDIVAREQVNGHLLILSYTVTVIVWISGFLEFIIPFLRD